MILNRIKSTKKEKHDNKDFTQWKSYKKIKLNDVLKVRQNEKDDNKDFTESKFFKKDQIVLKAHKKKRKTIIKILQNENLGKRSNRIKSTQKREGR